jgi:hypothetical protein
LRRDKEDCEEQEERYAREKYGENDIYNYIEDYPKVLVEKREIFPPHTFKNTIKISTPG